MNANKAQDVRYKVMECLRSAIQRDEGQSEAIHRMNTTNPLLIKSAVESEARIDLAKSILYALETGDMLDLKSFTLHS